MKIACVLFNYFPYGGLSRDMLRIAYQLTRRGHTVVIVTGQWNGELPKDIKVEIIQLPICYTNHGRAKWFDKLFQTYKKNNNFDLVVGFNRMTGLDVYYVADVCFRHIISNKRFLNKIICKVLPRYNTFLSLERKVFYNKNMKYLFLDKTAYDCYSKYYTIDRNRAYIVPPYIDRKCHKGYYSESEIQSIKEKIGIEKDEFIFIQVGSDFQRKGVDRSIRAFARLSEGFLKKSRLIIIGKGCTNELIKISDKLKVRDRIIFLNEQDDASIFIACSNVLIHPARVENTGTVIVEALSLGIPVICTSICGFSHYVVENESGYVVSHGDNIFDQKELDNVVKKISCKKNYLLLRGMAIKCSKFFENSSEIDHSCDLIESFLIK